MRKCIKKKNKFIFMSLLLTGIVLLLFIFNSTKFFLGMVQDFDLSSFEKMTGTTIFLVIWLIFVSIYHAHKKMPINLNYLGEEFRINSSKLEFLHDLTFSNRKNEIVYEQNIFDSLFEYINDAKKYILIDMFLYNSYKVKTSTSFRNLSKELTDVLIKKKKSVPLIKIDVITDPINNVYGGSMSKELEMLKQKDINVIVCDVNRLRDSNFLYSPVWRTFIQWFGNSSRNGFFKHPFSDTCGKVSLRSYFSMANLKANHRKVFVADNGDEMISLIASSNPHDGSSAHSNVALLVRGEVYKTIIHTEKAVANISKVELSSVEFNNSEQRDEEKNSIVQVITEKRIKQAIIQELKNLKAGDEVKVAQFYLSDRHIINSLILASKNGIAVCLILDPSKDAFGYKKNGIPNRPVAHELMKKSGGKIKIRWYDTHSEQFHSKLFMAIKNKKITAILGSANLTRRNLENYNLELNVKITVDADSKIAVDMVEYYSRIWNNVNGNFTVDYKIYEDRSFVKNLIYHFQERSGFSSF